MIQKERDELARLRKKEADEKQKKFDKEMAPALALWKRIQAKAGWK